jgi:hypothetical protein
MGTQVCFIGFHASAVEDDFLDMEAVLFKKQRLLYKQNPFAFKERYIMKKVVGKYDKNWLFHASSLVLFL